MNKPTAYSFVGSNIENLGGELERNCKKTSAECEIEWHKTGKAVGLMIWRIEKFKVVPWPVKQYGSFYDGDSYIVFKTYGNPSNFQFDVHFWLGAHTTADEAGTAAYKTVELDTFHDDKPVQYREVQGYESERFVSNFPNGIRILNGGIESGFHHVTAEAYKPRLLHLKGRRDIRVEEVPLERASLNSGDVFILDAGLKVYQWNGSKSSGLERNKGAQVSRALDDERGNVELTVLDEGSDQKCEAFWTLLGGHGPIKSAEAGGSDVGVASQKKLFQLSDASGHLDFTEVASGHISRSLLDSKDVFVFDIGNQIYVWIGKGASAQEKSKGMIHAQEYIKKYNRPPFLSICRIFEGGENECFEASFDH